MQQTKRLRTDLVRNTNCNAKTKINTRKTEVWQSSTHRKCQTEEVHLYKTDERPNRRGAKQERCQIAEAPNWRRAKQQRCKIAEVLVCKKMKDYERI